METNGSMRFHGPWVGGLVLALWIAGPSFGFLQEHVGTWSVPFYALVVWVALAVGGRWARRAEPWLDRHFLWMALVCLAGLLGAHLLLHPFEDGRGPLLSSDRDEALEVAVGRWLDGDYPYYAKSEVAGPLSVLPGGVLLALPFVMIGKVGLINVAWLVAFLFVMRREFGSAGRAIGLLVLMLGGSPAALYEFVSGGDLIANGIYVAVGVGLCLRCWSAEALRPGPALAAAAFLGVAVASRANFPLVCPLVLAWLWRRVGWRRALSWAGVTAGVSLGLILGFYFWDSQAFTPFMSRSKLMIGGAPEWTGPVVLAATGVAVVGFAVSFFVRRSVPDSAACFRACAWITLVPILGMILVASVLHGRLDFAILHDRFGLMWVPFALLGWGGLGVDACTKGFHPGAPSPRAIVA